MITSENVRSVTFDHVMRGYRCNDVDDYLKEVADSMDALTAQNKELMDNIQILARRIEEYRRDQDAVQSAMVEAQRSANKVLDEAKQMAIEIIRQAKIKADDQEQNARDEVELIRQEAVSIRKETETFKKNLMEMYKEHISLLSKFPTMNTREIIHREPAESINEPQPMEYTTEEPEQPMAEPPMDYPPLMTEPPAPQTTYQQPVAEEPIREEKIDTVEFSKEPIEEEQPEESADPELDSRFAAGAGLYDTEPPPLPEKKPAKGRGRKSTKKKDSSQTFGEQADAAPFNNVDFDV